MSDYSSLKATINANIKTNGNQEITGSVMNSVLNAMVTTLGAGYQYAGVATQSSNPGTPDTNVFYIAATAGTYTNMGGLVVSDGEVAIVKYNGTWAKDVISQLGQKTKEGAVKDAVYLSLVGNNKYMNQSGVIGTLNGYDLYEIKGLKGSDLLIIRENDGNPVLATGLGLGYLCQGILEGGTYIQLVNYLKGGGADTETESVAVIPLPDNIESIYFTKKHDESKNLSFLKVGGEIIRGNNDLNLAASVADIVPTNIFSQYFGLVYPRPGRSFTLLNGYNFAYAKLRKGDYVSFDNIDLTNLSTAGWVFTFNGGSLVSSVIGLVSEYVAESDCFLCVANKSTNTSPVAKLMSREYLSGMGRVLSQTDPSKNYKFVGCVLRNVNGVWQQIGGAHKSLNIAGNSQTSNAIRVMFDFEATNVVAFLTAPDEDFAEIGYETGSSVGLQYADIRIVQQFTMVGFVRKNGNTWDKYGDASSVVVQGNSVKIYHPNIGGLGLSFNIRNALFYANAGQVGIDFIEILLYNFDGTPVTQIPDQFGIYFTRSFHGTITPADANQSGNIWCFGIMEVE